MNRQTEKATTTIFLTVDFPSRQSQTHPDTVGQHSERHKVRPMYSIYYGVDFALPVTVHCTALPDGIFALVLADREQSVSATCGAFSRNTCPDILENPEVWDLKDVVWGVSSIYHEWYQLFDIFLIPTEISL